MLRKSPGFTIVGCAILALGIGANTAIFSVVNAVLLRPLPYRNAERLVSVKDEIRALKLTDVGMSVPEMWDLRDRSGVFEHISAIWPISANVTGSDQPERVEALAVSWNYFGMLGARPAMGRVFGRQDDTPGFADAAILSERLWRRMFGGDPGVLGRRLRLDNDLYTIVGVMPPGFRHPGRTIQDDVEIWITAGFSAAPFANPPQRAQRQIPGAIASIKPEFTIEQAQSKLDAFAADVRARFPNEYPAAANWAPRLVPLRDDLVGKVRATLFVVLGAVGFVLLICSVSLANLVLARSSARQRDTAVRLALGASRGNLIRLWLSESVLLALMGGAAGLLVVYWIEALLIRIAPVNLPRLNEVGMNWTVLAFCAAVSLLTGVAFGLAPAIQVSNAALAGNLKEGSRGSTAAQAQHRFRTALVASEVALSLILMAGAGLLLRSFWNLLDVNPGFNPKNMLVASFWMPAPNDPTTAPYRTPAARAAFVRQVLRRARQLPGVESAAMGTGNSIPLLGWNKRPLISEGRAADQAVIVENVSVSPEFFTVLQTPLKRGRVFTEADNSETPVVLVDEAAVQRFWPHEDPLNKRLKAPNPKAPWTTVVGVVGDIKADGLDAASVPHVYFPIYQNSGYSMTVFLRTASGPAAMGEALRREIQVVDRDMPVFGIKSMEQVMSASIAQRRFALQMIGAFALAALLLAGIGIYGVTAFSVSQRTQEIGIRMALGAQPGDVVRLVLKQGFLTMMWGMAAGLAGALLLTQSLRSLLFAASPVDPATFLAVSALLAGVVLLACYVPAVRAMRVDPAIALRSE
jgi:putative ABC transport system permease protein